MIKNNRLILTKRNLNRYIWKISAFIIPSYIDIKYDEYHQEKSRWEAGYEINNDKRQISFFHSDISSTTYLILIMLFITAERFCKRGGLSRYWVPQ